jgi:predicted dehydrogenase
MTRKNLGMIYGLGVHTIDQIISLLGTPNTINYDVRSLFNPGEGDDYMDLDFFYGNMKAIIKTSFIVKSDYPRFIVHGRKGSFIKVPLGHQSAIKDGPGPVKIDFEVEHEENWGKLSYIDDSGVEHNETVKTEIKDYGIIYDGLYESIFNGKEKPVTDEEILAVTRILQEATAARR